MKCCLNTAWAAAALLALCGCQAGGPADMGGPPKKPAVPAEMAKLNGLIGDWQGEFSMMPAGVTDPAQAMKMTSKTKIEPVLDGMFLRETMEGDMGEMGKMSGVSMYSYDPHQKEYRTFWFSNWGEAVEGDMEHDEKSGEWRMSWKGHSPTGQPVIGEAVMKLTDSNTLTWSMTEWDSWHMKKLMTGSGTAKRVK